MVKKIAIGADHGGFTLKERVKGFLLKKGYKVYDVGTDSPESCDYPTFAYEAAKKVSDGKASRGIVICKSGIGMAIVANKLPGVRASICFSQKDAFYARQHNDANVLVLAATKSGSGKALKIIETWLGTKALKGRHARRVKQIKALERKMFKKVR